MFAQFANVREFIAEAGHANRCVPERPSAGQDHYHLNGASWKLLGPWPEGLDLTWTEKCSEDKSNAQDFT